MSISERPIITKEKIFYVGENNDPLHRETHVFGYSASIATLQEGTNIIFFPIPSECDISTTNIIYSTESSVLKHMVNTISSFSRNSYELPAIEYKIFFAAGASLITDILDENNILQVEGMSSLANFIGEFYPQNSIVICTFDSFNDFRQFTFWMRYQPYRKDMFFLPTFVSNGITIDLEKELPCDYWTITSTKNQSIGVNIEYPNFSDDLSTYLPKKIVGKPFQGWYKNADTIASVDDIRVGLSDSIHRRPLVGIWHG